jgi:pSer/pThr/pTyr-binding forkhead associated (FHA) protein
MATMATPGVVSVCFSCGQPIDAARPAASAPRAKESYALTGAMPEAAPMPVNPYAKPGIGLVGEGRETRVSSLEMGVGRDPARCGILLAEPRVSGLHATVKLDSGLLHVRDEGSNNGTFVDGSRIAAHVWVPVRTGAELRFGPVIFAVTP